MQQAQDFADEAAALAALLDPLSEAELGTPTQFKAWTIEDILGHLYMFDHAAALTVVDEPAFLEFDRALAAHLAAGRTFVAFQRDWLGDLAGRRLFETWRKTTSRVHATYADLDPKRRLKWAGPDMSALSAITARQMETWAHGQAAFDILGQDRTEADRIKNIAFLGVNTYAWTFTNRGETAQEPRPFVRLIAPSGAEWTWGAPDPGNAVEGMAVDFCRVVTQTRHVADTALKTFGPVATRWMTIAQCFAGDPVDPPARGSRHKVHR